MTITDKGRWTSTVLDERGRMVKGSLTETGGLVFGIPISLPNYYLQMDGVDDKLYIPNLNATEFVLEFKPRPQTWDIYFYFGGLGINSNGTNTADQFHADFQAVYVDGVQATTNTAFIKRNTKQVLRGVLKEGINISGTSSFIYHNNGAGYMEGDIYSLKIYNGVTLLAHYDMSTGTVLDQSGNGNHATLTGGTWLDDGTNGIVYSHLQMDGVDDYIKTPSITFDKIFMDILLNAPPNARYIWDARTAYTGYTFKYANGTGGYGGLTSMYTDGATTGSLGDNFSLITFGSRHTIEFNLSTVATSPVSIFSHNNNSSNFGGNIYALRFYNGATKVAEYDIENGTVQDISGNGNHATLTGGTWVTMASSNPMVTIVSVDKMTISDETGMNQSTITFKFDKEVTQWEVRVLGAGQGTGTLADSGGNVLANTNISAVVDNIELSNSNGTYKVNIYGRGTDGTWTLYE